MPRSNHNPNSQRVNRIASAGQALYGDRWLRQLARVAGVSPQMLSLITTGQRALTPDVERKIAAAIGSEIKRLEVAQRALAKLRKAMDKDIQD
jgi:transcriptional regulator with XRE-family HTH domain